MTKQIIFFAWLSLFGLLAPALADERFPFLAEVSKESVNVRAGPNTNFEKVDELNKGAQVVVLGHYFEWYKVQPPMSAKAFIRSDYLKISADGAIAEVTGDNVNIRCRADSDAASLGEVKKGALVQILAQAKGWSSLAPVAGTAVWIHQDFLKQVAVDVPASLLIPALVWPGDEVKAVPKKTFELISVRGTLTATPVAMDTDVHYEVVIAGRPVFYLKDMPQIAYFSDCVIDLQGDVVPDPLKKFPLPVLHVDKISFVL